jgi:hypothetical protein
MSTRSATIELGGSAVRRPHLLIVAAMLALAVAAGIVVGRITGSGTISAGGTRASHAVVLPIGALSTGGTGAMKVRMYHAMNRMSAVGEARPALSGYSAFRRQASGA